jgi:3-oxoacyl-[acyl-carrier-protein] synthase II
MVASATNADLLVVSGWSVTSPFGLGVAPFTAGIRAGTSAVAPLDQQRWHSPFTEAGLVPDFDPATVLGRKGTRAMDRVTGLAVVTVGQLLAQYGRQLLRDPLDVGLVLGTTSGSVRSIIEFTRDTLVGEKPFDVDPAHFPNTVMNRAAGQSAIWYGLKGPNTTIAGGALTGLLALNYAARLWRQGRCGTFLCGAVEEFSAQRGWLEWHAALGGTPEPLGEGCVVLLLESAGQALANGRRPLATVLGSRFAGFAEPADIRTGLAHCAAELLKQADLTAADIDVVASCDAGGPLGSAEQAALADLVGRTGPARVHVRSRLGDTSAASAAFQLAAVLAGAGSGSTALVTSVDAGGTLGCTLLHLAS